ncbi:UNVERIFIED_CONTAM: hypothetical protein K2H54_025785 [Gekko kuhli]
MIRIFSGHVLRGKLAHPGACGGPERAPPPPGGPQPARPAVPGGASLHVDDHRAGSVLQTALVLVEPAAELGDLVALGPAAALEHDPPLLDDVEALEVGPVGGARGVVHGVDGQGAGRRAFLEQGGRPEAVLQALVPGDVVGGVGADPAVGRVRLLDVDQQEVGDVDEARGQALEGAQARHEGRSGAAAEVEDQRPLAPGVVQDAQPRLPVQLDDLRVGRRRAHVRRLEEVQLLPVPHGLERLQREHAVGVGHAERRVVGRGAAGGRRRRRLLLLLLGCRGRRRQQELLPDAQEIQEPEHHGRHEEPGQKQQTGGHLGQRLQGVGAQGVQHRGGGGEQEERAGRARWPEGRPAARLEAPLAPTPSTASSTTTSPRGLAAEIPLRLEPIL